ncbi:LamG-like jellyroll fold domain-containing protein [Snuella lapsa]|uniref:Secretion system C-terminal sorting domain-containing protein n=1 Tax=Snuella lapsa TaxID=870481 RepID=A0ABP6X637_9FLAO
MKIKLLSLLMLFMGALVFGQTLQANYEFATNGDLTDVSGNGRTLTKTGSLLKTFVTDNYNNATSAFDAQDATGEYLVATGYKGINGNNARTVTAWVNLRVGGNRRTIASWGINSSGKMFNVMIEGGKIRVEGGTCSILSDGVATNSVWHHIAVTFDPTTDGAKLSSCKMYIDGELQAIGSSYNPSTVLNTDSGTNDLRIGEAVYGTTHFYRGALNDIRIYSKALTSSEVTNVMSGATLGVNDVTFSANELKAYPTVVKDYLMIETNVNQTLDIVVYNLLGKVVNKINSKQSVTEINMDDLASGVYIVKVRSGLKVSGIKVIKE